MIKLFGTRSAQMSRFLGYRDVMAWAPLSKIVIGSGGHGTLEIAWLAAKTAKIALSEVMEDAVRL